MLAGLEHDLERGLRPRTLGDRLGRKLKRLPLGNPALHVVEAPLAAELVEDSDLFGGFGESERQIVNPRVRHGPPILARATPAITSLARLVHHFPPLVLSPESLLSLIRF